jgi:hypothetical protein
MIGSRERVQSPQPRRIFCASAESAAGLYADTVTVNSVYLQTQRKVKFPFPLVLKVFSESTFLFLQTTFIHLLFTNVCLFAISTVRPTKLVQPSFFLLSGMSYVPPLTISIHRT